MDLAGFLAVALVVVVTPGPDMALVLRNTLASGRIAGLATGLPPDLNRRAARADASS